MKILKVSTKDPQDFYDAIQEKIVDRSIASWELDDSNKFLSHKGSQYRDHFYFEYQINKPKGLAEFVFHSSGTSSFADSRAFQLLESMLTRHFEDEIELIK